MDVLSILLMPIFISYQYDRIMKDKAGGKE